MDQRTRNLMKMNKSLHIKDDFYRLYVTRKEGESGLVTIQDSVDSSVQRLKNYIKNAEED